MHGVTCTVRQWVQFLDEERKIYIMARVAARGAFTLDHYTRHIFHMKTNNCRHSPSACLENVFLHGINPSPENVHFLVRKGEVFSVLETEVQNIIDFRKNM